MHPWIFAGRRGGAHGKLSMVTSTKTKCWASCGYNYATFSHQFIVFKPTPCFTNLISVFPTLIRPWLTDLALSTGCQLRCSIWVFLTWASTRDSRTATRAKLAGMRRDVCIVGECIFKMQAQLRTLIHNKFVRGKCEDMHDYNCMHVMNWRPFNRFCMCPLSSQAASISWCLWTANHRQKKISQRCVHGIITDS